MNLSKLILGLLIFGCAQAMAAGKGGHDTNVLDLKWPFINFSILLGFLIFKLKKPVKEMFDKNAVVVKETYDYAEGKNKEAEIKLKMYKDKLQNFSATTRKIKGEAEREVRQFEENKVKESGNMVKRLERDAASKIMYEKKLMINNLNHEFLDAVIGQVKTTIGSDKAAQEKATKNLLSEI